MNNPERQIIRVENCTARLQELMQAAGINSFNQLYRSTGTSAHTINKLRSGELNTLRWQTILNISITLQISAIELIDTFGDKSQLAPEKSPDRSLAKLRSEYSHLQQQLQQQQAALQAEFQSQSLQVLESFLTYFPTAKYAAIKNPDFPATKLFPLVGSIDKLIAQWGVTVIGAVGNQIPYDPQFHQLIEGSVNPDELVTVRYVGYQHGNKLLFRAKVSKI
jgi:DNA-binding Xre family transcriptional regulator/molecular chaperone GrpE (heat shock protein)